MPYFWDAVVDDVLESWVLTAEQQHRLDVFARTCYRVMLNIRQTDAHITNKHLYEMTGGEQPISVSIRKRKIQFVHCLRMATDEPAKLTAEEIAKIAVDKKTWFKFVAAPHQPDWWWWCGRWTEWLWIDKTYIIIENVRGYRFNYNVTFKLVLNKKKKIFPKFL